MDLMADWLSVDEAAELSGYSAEYIRRLIRNAKILAQKKGLMWWVDRHSLQAYLKEATDSDDPRRGPKQN
jgi:excisionase family DNA binding protein